MPRRLRTCPQAPLSSCARVCTELPKSSCTDSNRGWRMPSFSPQRFFNPATEEFKVLSDHRWSSEVISGHQIRSVVMKRGFAECRTPARRVSYAGSPSVVRGLAECRTSARRVSYAGAPSVVRRVAECRTAGRRRTQNDPKRPKTTPKPPQNHPKFTHTLTKLTDYFLILFLVRDETDCVMQ